MSFDNVSNDVSPGNESRLSIAISALHPNDASQYVRLLVLIINRAVGYNHVEKLKLTAYKDAERYRQKLQRSDALLFVAKSGDRVVGVVDGEIAVDGDTGERHADIHWVGVEQHVQRRRVARALVLTAEASSRGRASSIRTFIKDENTASIALFEGLGYLVDTSSYTNGGRYYMKRL